MRQSHGEEVAMTLFPSTWKSERFGGRSHFGRIYRERLVEITGVHCLSCRINSNKLDDLKWG